MIVSFPAGGKSTLAQEYIAQGFVHLNRDKQGGKVISLVPLMEDAVKQGKNVVLDNTFPTIESRKPFIDSAKRLGATIECKVLASSIEDAQFNAATRMVRKHGKLLSNEEIKQADDPNTFPVVVLFAYRKQYQEPTTAEGFDALIEVQFIRKIDPSYNKKALLLDYDGTLRVTMSGAKFPINPDDIMLLPDRAEILRKKKAEGYLLLGVSNQSGIAKGDFTEEAARKCFEKTNKLLGLDIDVAFCPHKVPPVSCFCRKPGVGMGVYFIEKYKLNAPQCIMVGDLTTDKTFAKRCDFKYIHADEFFNTKVGTWSK